jgi:hypothetical protein
LSGFAWNSEVVIRALRSPLAGQFATMSTTEHDVLDRAVARTGAHGGDLVDDGLGRVVGDLAEDRVLALQPRVGSVVMKNCEPLVPSAWPVMALRRRPALAIARM